MKEVDMVIISWAKNDTLKKVTEDGIKSCIESDPDIKFNFYIVETNKEATYDLPNTKTIYPESKFGYHRYLNIGRKAGNSKYVCLCNNDLTYENLWASIMVNFMETNPDIKSTSPWCPQTQGSNVNHIDNAYTGYGVRKEVAGWCIFQQREIYETIGDLDEQFEFWYCDNDYSMTLRSKKINHVMIPSSVVNHHEDPIGKTGKLIKGAALFVMTKGQDQPFIKKWLKYAGDLKVLSYWNR